MSEKYEKKTNSIITVTEPVGVCGNFVKVQKVKTLFQYQHVNSSRVREFVTKHVEFQDYIIDFHDEIIEGRLKRSRAVIHDMVVETISELEALCKSL